MNRLIAYYRSPITGTEETLCLERALLSYLFWSSEPSKLCYCFVKNRIERRKFLNINAFRKNKVFVELGIRIEISANIPRWTCFPCI